MAEPKHYWNIFTVCVLLTVLTGVGYYYSGPIYIYGIIGTAQVYSIHVHRQIQEWRNQTLGISAESWLPISLATIPAYKSKEYREKLIAGKPIAKLFPCPDSIGSNHSCQYYQPDWKSNMDTGKLMAGRIIEIRDKCERFYSHMFNSSLSRHGSNHSNRMILKEKSIRINKRLKLAFCWMPKMGSTFWSRAWAPMNNAPSNVSAKNKNSLTHSKLTQFVEGHNSSIDLDGYNLFTISRSPWDRIVSVYREKCEKNKNGNCQLGFKVGANMKCNPFIQFVKCLLHAMGREVTEYYGHLDTTYHRCGACDYPYKYVVAMENMETEMKFLLQQAGVLDPISVMDQVRNKTIRPVEAAKIVKNVSYSLEYWKSIPPTLIDKVRFYFRYEIALFNYAESPFYMDPSI